jgi:hypothetical protein
MIFFRIPLPNRKYLDKRWGVLVGFCGMTAIFQTVAEKPARGPAADQGCTVNSWTKK